MKKYNTNLFGQKLNVSQAIDSNAEGKGTITRNIGENANGTFNVSNTGSENSKKTIHSIGIGTKDSDRSNALEIMQNGDIYLYGVGGYEGDNASDSKSIQSVIQDSQSGGDYTLPIASADTLGGIKVGEGLNIDGEGVLSSTGGGVGKVDSQQDFEGQLIYGEIFNCYQGENKNTATGIASHSEGLANRATGYCCHTEGAQTFSQNICEHAEGMYNKSNKGETPADQTLHSIGIGASDNGRKNAVEVMQNGDVYINGVGSYDGTNYADAQTLQEVINSQSGGGVGKVDSESDGTGEIFNDYTNNKATGINAHAEGSNTKASGTGSHAEGLDTKASYLGAHAEGLSTTADGTGSHAEGQETSALSSWSHVEGFLTIANNMYEHAQGTNNMSNTGSSDSDKTIHSIGIGKMSSNRRNAVEVMTNGDLYIYGIGSYNGTNYRPAQTLQEVISNIQNTIWIGTQTQYDQLESKNENTLYFITE